MRKITKAFIGGTLLSLSSVSGAFAIELTEVSEDRIEKPAAKEVSAPARTVAPQAQNTAPAPAPEAPKAESRPAPAPQTATAAEEPVAPARKASYVAYISDNSSIWATRGPGRQYKLTGQIRIGERVEVLSEKNDYVEIRTPKDTIVWVPKKDIQKEESNLYKVTRLEEENNTLKYKLDNIDSETIRDLRKTSAELAELKKAYTDLKQLHEDMEIRLRETTEENEELSSKLETKDQDMQLRWWKQGGLIALIGAIVGVILVYLPRPRRKDSDYYY